MQRQSGRECFRSRKEREVPALGDHAVDRDRHHLAVHHPRTALAAIGLCRIFPRRLLLDSLGILSRGESNRPRDELESLTKM